jgi:hypothetical protein
MFETEPLPWEAVKEPKVGGHLNDVLKRVNGDVEDKRG